MQWQDKGIVLSSKKYGEHSLIIRFLTEEHGVYSGLVKFGLSKKQKFLYEPGNLLSISWVARLPEHMGSFRCDTIKLYTSKVMGKSSHLAALTSHCSLEQVFLPERERCKNIYNNSIKFIEQLSVDNDSWLYDYVRWEISFLEQLGYGLTLNKCAVTGKNNDLLYVSPKTGRAISKVAAGKWVNKLLPLPSFLINKEKDNKILKTEFMKGILLTGFFLSKYADSVGVKLPYARNFFINKIN